MALWPYIPNIIKLKKIRAKTIYDQCKSPIYHINIHHMNLIKVPTHINMLSQFISHINLMKPETLNIKVQR